MDFPLSLSAPNSDFVYSLDEFKQVISLVLKEQVGNFLQSHSLGAQFSIHSSDETSIQVGIENTISNISGVEIDSIEVNLPEVKISLSYQDSIVNFQFNVEDYDY